MMLTVNGLQAFAATGGVDFDPQLPTVVFIHGAGMDHTVWTLYARYHARHGRSVLSVDLPGHGKSEGEPLASVEEMADWVLAMLNAAGVSKAHLLGHSMGSLVALEAAARAEIEILGVGLLGTAYPMAVGAPLLAAAKANDHAAIDMIALFGFDADAQLGGNPVAGVNMLNTGVRLMERAADGVIHNDLNACNAYDNGTAAAQNVSCPVTLILGQRDKMTPVKATRGLLDALAHGRVEVLPGCGHMMMVEAPEKTHQAMAKMLAL